MSILVQNYFFSSLGRYYGLGKLSTDELNILLIYFFFFWGGGGDIICYKNYTEKRKMLKRVVIFTFFHTPSLSEIL